MVSMARRFKQWLGVALVLTSAGIGLAACGSAGQDVAQSQIGLPASSSADRQICAAYKASLVGPVNSAITTGSWQPLQVASVQTALNQIQSDANQAKPSLQKAALAFTQYVSKNTNTSGTAGSTGTAGNTGATGATGSVGTVSGQLGTGNLQQEAQVLTGECTLLGLPT